MFLGLFRFLEFALTGSFHRAERPIRSFEVLGDVCNSWLADKTVSYLMAKKTPLAPKLSRAVSGESGRD